jgi:transcriptional regulator with XRE-family HTH domain
VTSPADRELLAAVGLRIRVAPVARRWTQEQLAEAAGLSSSCVARLELGRHALTVVTVRRIAGAVGVSLGELLGRAVSGPAVVLRDRSYAGMLRPVSVSTPLRRQVSIVDRRGSCRSMRRPA